MPWLTPIVFKQGPKDALTRLPRFGDGPRRIRFRHIVHAYRDAAVPENTAVQSITFDTIRAAARFAAPDYPVACVGVTFPEETDLLPAGVVVAAPLHRRVTDVAAFRAQRSLPLLFDILRNGAAAPAGFAGRGPLAALREGGARLARGWRREPAAVEYLVLSNSDIHVQPAFYRVLAELIRQGYDVLTVNRRTLDVDRESRAFTPLFMADRGKDHAGFDCFVFPRDMLDRFVRSDSCCGAGMVMRSLLFNLVAHARRFLMLTQAQLTYHLGDDRFWADPAFADYVEFNTRAARAVVAALSQDPEMAGRLRDFIAAHEGAAFRDLVPALAALRG